MALLRLILRYGLVGLANTIVGFGIILICDVGLHLRPEIANAIGYLTGWVLGYVLSRGFVFKSNAPHRVTGLRYTAAVMLSFLANQIVLHVALTLAPSGTLGHLVGQASGLMVYTSLMFVLSSLWVFRGPPPIP